MSILKIDDLIENDDNLKFELNGKSYQLNADLKTILKYEKLIEEFKENGDVEIYTTKFIDLILGEKEAKEFNENLKEKVKSAKQIDRIWTLLITKWMDEVGISKKGGDESEKKQ